MSIRRIESAYATYFGDKRLSGTDMSVLIALSYVANERRNEDCYPTDGYISQLTHLCNKAVRDARDALREQKVITWISGGNGRKGGNVSNRYRFLFPHKKMASWRERYQPFGETPMVPDAEPTAPDAEPTAPGAVPYGTTCPTLRYQTPTNTERIPKRTSESKSEPAVVSTSGIFESLVDKRVAPTPKRKRTYSILTQMALKACKVSDTYNANSFEKVLSKMNPDLATDEIFAFKSEVGQGEHDGADNLASVLMSRLQARL